MRPSKMGIIVTLLLALPLTLAAAEVVFVFDRSAPTASVYDAGSLELIAKPKVGMGASHAFGVGDPREGGRFDKFYVVSRSAIVILDPDFSILGNLFLSGTVPAAPGAADMSPDGGRLLVAAGDRVYLVDTSQDQIVAELAPGFAPTSLAVLPDSDTAYVASSRSTLVRTIDLKSGQLSELVRVLPAAPTSLSVGPDSRVYATPPGELYQLDLLPELPLPTDSGISTSYGPRVQLAGQKDATSGQKAAGQPKLGGRKLSIDEFLVLGGGNFYMKAAGRLVQGVLSQAGSDLEMKHPVTSEPFGPNVVDLALSSSRRAVFLALNGEPRLVKLGRSNPDETEEITLSSTPTAIAVVSPRLGQSSGSLEQVSGDGTIFAGGRAFELTVRALSENGTAQSRIPVFASNIFPEIAQCFPGLTAGNGRATVYCVSDETEVARPIIVTISDGQGRSAPPFTVRVRPPTETEGLSKVSGDEETIGANSPFELVVFAAKDRVIQTGLPLTVTFDSDVTDDIEFSCTSPALTDSNGEGHIMCMTGDPTDPDSTTVIELDITVTDGEGRSVEFMISIDPTVLTGLTSTGLFKISGDGQIVRQGQLFPKPMIVHSLIDSVPQAGERLVVSNTSQALPFNQQKIICPLSAFTDDEGFARVQCRAGLVFGLSIERVVFSGPQLRVAEFSAIISSVGGGLASEVVILNDSPFRAQVGVRLVNELLVRTQDSGGAAVAEQEVFFFSDDDVTFDPPSIITDTLGEGTTTVIIGCNSRSRATIKVGLKEGVTEDSIRVEGLPGPLTEVRKIRGDDQVGSPGQLLNRAALVVRLTDACGNPIPSHPMTWHVNPEPRATLRNVFKASNRSGEGSAIVQLSRYGGPFGVSVEAGDGRTAFNLTVDLDPSSMERLSGDGQSIGAGQFAAQPLVVEVEGRNGFGVSGVDVTFAVTRGDATLVSPETKTDGLGVAFTRIRGGPTNGTVTVTAAAAGQTVTFNLSVGGGAPAAALEAFVNGASFEPGWVPGSLGTVFVTGLLGDIDGVVQSNRVPFPTTLEGVSVTVNGTPAPIVSVINIDGQEQINLQVPFGTRVGAATVVIEKDGLSITVEGVPIHSVQPGIFEFPLDGKFFAAALDIDNKLITPSNPVRPGGIVQLFLTGLGRLTTSVGTNNPGPASPLPRVVVETIVGIDDAGMKNLGAFYAPGLLMVYQINFEVGANVQSGNRKLTIVGGGVASKPSLLPVRR